MPLGVVGCNHVLLDAIVVGCCWMKYIGPTAALDMLDVGGCWMLLDVE